MFLFTNLFNKKYLKDMLAVLGVILWIGALSPEIFVKSGIGCILDENGEELTAEGAEAFMESYFYGIHDEEDENTVEIKFKFALMDFFE